MFNANYIDAPIATTVRIQASASWYDQALDAKYAIVQGIVNNNLGTIHSFINGQVQNARGKAFWGHEYVSYNWSARFSSNSGQMLCVITVMPENALPSGSTINTVGLYTLDVPFTTYPLIGQAIRDQGYVTDYSPEMIQKQTPLSATYAPGDESNNFEYLTGGFGSYSADPGFFDEAPNAHNYVSGGIVYDTQGNHLTQFDYGGPAHDQWYLKHVAASLIGIVPLRDSEYFECVILALADPGTPQPQTVTIDGNTDANTYAQTDVSYINSKSVTLKFHPEINQYQTPAIGIAPKGMADPTWKKPTVCYGRVLGLGMGSGGVFITRSQMRVITSVEVKAFFPGFYWMADAAVYETGIHPTSYTEYTWTSDTPEHTLVSTETGYGAVANTRPWDAPSTYPDKLLPLNTILMPDDRNPALISASWMVEPGAGEFVVVDGQMVSCSASQAWPMAGINGGLINEAVQLGIAEQQKPPFTGTTAQTVTEFGHTTTYYYEFIATGYPIPAPLPGNGLLFPLYQFFPQGGPPPSAPPNDPTNPNDNWIWGYMGSVNQISIGTVGALSSVGGSENVAGVITHKGPQLVSDSIGPVGVVGDFLAATQPNRSECFATFKPNIWNLPIPGKPQATLNYTSATAQIPDANVGDHTWIINSDLDPATGQWAGDNMGPLKEGDTIMIAVNKKGTFFGKNGKWYDRNGVSHHAPGTKELAPTASGVGVGMVPCCSARVGRTKLQMRFGDAIKYLPPGGFEAYGAVTVNLP